MEKKMETTGIMGVLYGLGLGWDLGQNVGMITIINISIVAFVTLLTH